MLSDQGLSIRYMLPSSKSWMLSSPYALLGSLHRVDSVRSPRVLNSVARSAVETRDSSQISTGGLHDARDCQRFSVDDCHA
jgi:hypothetical protein